MTQTFKTKTDGFKYVKRRKIFRDFPIFILSIFLGLLLFTLGRFHGTINWYVVGSSTLILSAIVGFVTLQMMTTERHKYEDFVLTIDDDEITAEKYDTPTLTIAANEVRKIYRNRNGELVILGTPGSERMIIPSPMEDPEKLELKLAGIRPFSSMPFEERYWLLAPLIVFSLMAVIYLTSNEWLIGTSGLILLGLYGISIYNSYKYKKLADIPKSRIFLSLYVAYFIVRETYSQINGG